MNRRDAVPALLALGATPYSAWAQQPGRTVRVALILGTSPVAEMTGNFTGILAPLVRLGFALTGIMLLLPHQVSSAMLWVNIAGAFLGVPLLVFERKTRHRRPASPAI